MPLAVTIEAQAVIRSLGWLCTEETSEETCSLDLECWEGELPVLMKTCAVPIAVFLPA